MSQRRVKIGDLSNVVLEEMKNYTQSVGENVRKAVDSTAKNAATELHSAGSFKGITYKHYWTTKITKGSNFESAVVHNSQQYRLTHLLEHGHVIKNGTGRTFGRTRAFVHIAPVEEKAAADLEKLIKEAIENG